MNELEINVADLRRSRATDREVTLDAIVDWRLELSAVEGSADGKPNLSVELTLSPVGGGLMARGFAGFVARHTCHRCLTEWTEAARIPVSAMFSAHGEEDDGTFPFGDVIDLEPAVRDDVLVAMPLLPTCHDGCDPQLVGDGENGLNTTRPGDQNSADDVPEAPDVEGSPFAVLRDLLDGGGGSPK